MSRFGRIAVDQCRDQGECNKHTHDGNVTKRDHDLASFFPSPPSQKMTGKASANVAIPDNGCTNVSRICGPYQTTSSTKAMTRNRLAAIASGTALSSTTARRIG